jgi:hypothetical protein
VATAPGAAKVVGAAPPAKPAERASPDTKAPPAAAAKLDLGSLQVRLRQTPAIGLFTKISLKNQVDDLLGQFREFYRGTLKISLAALRQPVDLLLLKVLSLLQDGDPTLAEAIVASREAMWRILADSATFAALELAAGETR